MADHLIPPDARDPLKQLTKYGFKQPPRRSSMNRRYVLLTAAKDEEAYIGEVVSHILRQTVRPLAWFIVDDGSSDRTASIIESFAAEYPFIHLQSSRCRGGRNFSSQYKAIMAAYSLAKSLEFDFLGIVDADQAPKQCDYYETILQEFDRNPRLGVASGFVHERTRGAWGPRPENSSDSVAASAVFRRCCFDQIGGYTPLYYGGSDWLIQLDAKMASWEIKTRPDLHILHYRPTSSAGGIWRGKFRNGMMDASFGSDPVFEFFKCGRRVISSPLFLGSLVQFCGYLWWKFSAREPLISAEKVAYLRREQRAKLRRWIVHFGACQI
jgi:poly-beta-1,6-N-acetyl-D-glucosamine synthase